MVNVQENLNDNKDSLEKKSRSLSGTEQGNLEGIKNNQDIIENAKKTEIKLKDKIGKEVTTTALELMKAIAKGVSLAQGTNYKMKLENANIEINGKKIDNSELGRGSELIAFLQVAAGGNLVPDGKFGANTAKAFSELLNADNSVPTKLPETKIEATQDLSDIKTNNYGDSFNVLLGNNAKNYDQYKIFSSDAGRQGYFNNCYVNSSTKDIIITYYSPVSKLNTTVTFKEAEILATGRIGKVDVNKFMNALKTKIDANEAKIQKEKGKESVGDGVEDVEVSSFSPFMQEYIKGQGWIALNGEIDFKPGGVGNGSGMNIQGDKLYITFPGKGTNGANLVVPYSLKDFQTNNKFDEKKFIVNVTNQMTPRAQKWKKDQLATRYNNIQGTKIGSLSTTYNIDNYIKTYENINKDINTYSKNGVVVDKKIIDDIPVKINQLKNQKDYIRAKNRSEVDIKSFEEFYKRSGRNAPSAGEIKAKDKELAAKINAFEKGTVTLYTGGELNIKNAYSKVNKLNEYNAYLERYKKLS